MPSTPNGVILWEGQSELDGMPIVVIATGTRQGSTNRKTGAMLQTYILRADVAPIDAVKTGADASICGGCVHRGDGTGKGRSCYVTLAHGPRSVFAAYKRGAYPYLPVLPSPRVALQAVGAGRRVRLGTYGDPAAVPAYVWYWLLADSDGHTGYTHQWRDERFDSLRDMVMASADTPREAEEAQARGWRTFRVGPSGLAAGLVGEVLCPASEEAGKRTTCERCGLCSGARQRKNGRPVPSVFIPAHGAGKGHADRRAA